MSAQKLNAARAALDYVEDGMILGLGSGSTAAEFVRLLGAALKQDEIAIKGIPTSRETEQIAREAGVPLIPIEQADRIDLTVDGADEVDGRFRLIKGGGAKINDAQVTDERASVGLDAINADGVIKLSAGKKRHALIRPV